MRTCISLLYARRRAISETPLGVSSLNGREASSSLSSHPLPRALKARGLVLGLQAPIPTRVLDSHSFCLDSLRSSRGFAPFTPAAGLTLRGTGCYAPLLVLRTRLLRKLLLCEALSCGARSLFSELPFSYDGPEGPS